MRRGKAVDEPDERDRTKAVVVEEEGSTAPLLWEEVEEVLEEVWWMDQCCLRLQG